MMGIRIGLDISSLRAQRSLQKASGSLSSAFERLSSGLRINTASDDAAGLSIASSLKTDARVFSQALRNTNDGVSAVNIASASLEQLTLIATRLKELAEQAASGTLNFKQRASLDQEAQELSKEYFRIARTTEFNGLNLLDGSLGPLSLQVGYGNGGCISNGLGGAVGQGTLGSSSTYAIGSDTRGMTTCDFNGDGAMDIATSDFASDLVLIGLGNGDGTFRAATLYATATGPQSINTGDFNGDGVVDLVVADGSGASVFIGNNDGTFKARSSYVMGPGPNSVGTGDVNGDGILDLFSADFGGSFGTSASVIIGNGDGTFKNKVAYTTGVSPYAIAGEDVNADGKLDLVTSEFMLNTVGVLLGNGDGTFKKRISYNAGASPRSVSIADLNNDGKFDLVTGSSSSSNASVMLGNGDGSFKAQVSYATGASVLSLTTMDLNGDNVLDLAATDWGAGGGTSLSMLLGNGDGSFRARVTYGMGSNPRAIASGDFNGDGVPDIAAVTTGEMRVFLTNTRDGVSPLLPFSLRYQADARQAVSMFDATLANLDLHASVVGAIQSRMKSTLNTISTALENYSAARSRIEDTDIADESARLVKDRICQLAATAVLAQANQSPALALKLLAS